MNIAYASDDRFTGVLAVSMTSLFENNDSESITVFIFSDGISSNNKCILYDLGEKYGQRVEIIDVNPDNYSAIKLNPLSWSRTTFSRMFIGTILKPYNLERIIYLDCDTIVNSSLRELWEIELNGFALGMAVDPISVGHKKNVGIKESKPYYNAGVMLIDLDKWNEAECEKRIQDFSISRNGKVPYADQGIINGALYEFICSIPLRYNLITIYCDYEYDEILTIRKPKGYFYERGEVEDARKNPNIIHFTKSVFTDRPWIDGSTHPEKDLWNKYEMISPWKGITIGNQFKNEKKHKYRTWCQYLPRSISVVVQGFLHSIVKPIIDKR